MDSYLYGDIIAGERVGNFYLGCNLEKLRTSIDFNYTLTEAQDCYILKCEDIDFFVTKNDNRLYQITIFGKYKGKLLNRITIGNILADTKDIISCEMEKESNDGEFYLPDHPGVSIYTKGWGDDQTPITHISVYDYRLSYEKISST